MGPDPSNSIPCTTQTTNQGRYGAYSLHFLLALLIAVMMMVMVVMIAKVFGIFRIRFAAAVHRVVAIVHPQQPLLALELALAGRGIATTGVATLGSTLRREGRLGSVHLRLRVRAGARLGRTGRGVLVRVLAAIVAASGGALLLHDRLRFALAATVDHGPFPPQGLACLLAYFTELIWQFCAGNFTPSHTPANAQTHKTHGELRDNKRHINAPLTSNLGRTYSNLVERTVLVVHRPLSTVAGTQDRRCCC